MGKWLGTSELMPESCHSLDGHARDSGTYRVVQDGDWISIAIDWVTDGTAYSTAFSAHLDSRQDIVDYPGIDGFWVLAKDDATLLGDATSGERVVSKVVRRVSADGQLMSVLQENNLPQTDASRII